MERKILKYLYEFYKNGDYINFHPLIPVFEKLEKGNDYRLFLERIKAVLADIETKNLIELSSKEYNSWSTIKTGDILFDYNNNPVNAKLTSEGEKLIERVLLDEKLNEVNNSVITTNNVSIRTNIASLLILIFTSVITILQYCKKDSVTPSDIKELKGILKELKPQTKAINTIYLLNPIPIQILDTVSKQK